MATVQVGKDGKAQKGLSVGTTVKTAGGNYKITGVKPDGSYISTKVGSPTPASSGGSGSSSPSYTNYVNTYGNEGYANLIRAKEAAGQQLDDRSAADLFKSANPGLFGVQPIQQQAPPQQPNLVGMARQQSDQEQAAAMAKMQAARARATGELNLQRQGVAPAYSQLKNQASASTMQAAQRLREMMAANGLGQSGENVSAQVALGAQGGRALNDLNLQEKARLNEIDQGIANVNNADEEAAIIAQLSAEKTRAIMDAQARQSDLDYRNKQFDENVRQFGVTSNRAELQRQAEQRATIATMLGVDPVTGKPTLAGTKTQAGIANDALKATQSGQRIATANQKESRIANRSTTKPVKVDPADSTDNYYSAVDQIKAAIKSKSDPAKVRAYIQALRGSLTASDYAKINKFYDDNNGY